MSTTTFQGALGALATERDGSGEVRLHLVCPAGVGGEDRTKDTGARVDRRGSNILLDRAARFLVAIDPLKDVKTLETIDNARNGLRHRPAALTLYGEFDVQLCCREQANKQPCSDLCFGASAKAPADLSLLRT
ncbi:MAG: hypothetical protein SFZ23_05565 [Planctomycetota bacterium]|nr:hypothetical protein [Planctomycetota bacterium]